MVSVEVIAEHDDDAVMIGPTVLLEISYRLRFRIHFDIMLQHVLNVLLFAVVPLTLAGIGAHLATEELPKGSSKRRNIAAAVWILALIGIGCGVLVELLNSKADKRREAEAKEFKAKLDSVGEQNNRVLSSLSASKPLSESERRQQIENALRGEYILSHDPIDPLILADEKYPPAEWMNQRLQKMGENWNIRPVPNIISAEKKIRSYLVTDGSPLFPSDTSASTPGELKVGLPLAFNVAFHNTGPNPILGRRSIGLVMLLPGYDAATQARALADFNAFTQKHPIGSPDEAGTLNPGDRRFVTFSTDVVQPGRLPMISDSMLENLHTGRQIIFIFSEFDYVDQGILHHQRNCSILQPPARTLDPIFASCRVFKLSD